MLNERLQWKKARTEQASFTNDALGSLESANMRPSIRAGRRMGCCLTSMTTVNSASRMPMAVLLKSCGRMGDAGMIMTILSSMRAEQTAACSVEVRSASQAIHPASSF
jgi:hypothetical protein